jgi:two-component system, OmpR family, sensor kinase
MRRIRSIAARLSVVFLSLFLLTILLGLFSIASLGYFNTVSSQVQRRWLPSTGALGDLNNFTSDFRAAEADALLATNPDALAAREKEMDDLDRAISKAEREYTQVPHDPTEHSLYGQFAAAWDHYRGVVRQVQSFSEQGARVAAVDLYNTTSKTAYDAASNILGLLTDRNVASAREATMRAETAYNRARWLIAVTMILAGLSVAGALIHVRRSISAPLLGLAGRMHRLVENETSIEVDGTERQDEIGEMARAVVVFRNNAIELMASRRGLEQQASMLQEKLAEERRLMLRQRNFVSMASHEFRTPLTLIDAHAQRLIRMRDRLRPEDLNERAGKIRSAVLRLTHLIDHLIDSSRVIDGEVELYFHPASMDLTLLLAEVCHVQREIAPWAQILESFGSEPLMLTGDSKLLFQVFSNLLSNAIKYSPRGGAIEVTMALDGPLVAVTVEDHGIGVPEADCERVFERYYRGSNAAGIVGTGVGLYFAKTVVELHRGDITLRSREGEGCRFTVRLPLKFQPHEEGASPALASA